ncbi:MAG: hypothetical protein ACREX8_00045, partial [Gammaproteobacteria bacterium]
MPTGTTLVAFKQAFRASLLLRPALAAVQISYSEPRVFVLDDAIWFHDAIASDALAAMRSGGVFSVEEDYRLIVRAQSVTLADDGQETVDLRAAGLLREIQQELAATPQTIPDVMLAELGGWKHSPGQLTEDRSG